MATFPSYMKPLTSEFGKTPNPMVIRTPMEDGMIKQAKSKSRALVVRPMMFMINSLANFQAWETFFNTTINGGADWFDWTDPVDSVTKSARVVEGSYSAKPLNNLISDWVVSLRIETWSS